MFDYRPRYYLTHPWILFDELYLEIKWAWQRIFRGWDDRVIWGLDSYLCEYMPVWLRKLKKKQGCPLEMYSDPYKTSYSDEEFKEAQKRWHNLLEEIAEGFEAGKHYIEDDFPAWKQLQDEEEKRFSKDKNYGSVEYLLWSVNDSRREELRKELHFRENLDKERDKAYKKFMRALNLFSHYFFSLWT